MTPRSCSAFLRLVGVAVVLVGALACAVAGCSALDGGAVADVQAAAAGGDVGELRRLRADGVSMGLEGENWVTPLMVAASHDPTGSATAYLIEVGVDVDARDDVGSSALTHALVAGNVEAARLLLAAGARVDTDACQTVGTSEVSSDADQRRLGDLLGCP